MTIYLATDHAGFELKEKIKHHLIEDGFTVEDCGAYEYDPNDDYPDFIRHAAEKISENPENKAIIFGGSGQAENMVANKFRGVRSALFYAPASPTQAADISGRVSDDVFEIVRLTRIHNNANVLSLGVRFLQEEDAYRAVKIFLETDFSGEERHVRRIEKMNQMENHA